MQFSDTILPQKPVTYMILMVLRNFSFRRNKYCLTINTRTEINVSGTFSSCGLKLALLSVNEYNNYDDEAIIH